MVYTLDMSRSKPPSRRWPIKTWRPNGYDRAIMARLGAKLGLPESDVLRLALRRMAEFENVRVEDLKIEKRA